MVQISGVGVMVGVALPAGVRVVVRDRVSAIVTVTVGAYWVGDGVTVGGAVGLAVAVAVGGGVADGISAIRVCSGAAVLAAVGIWIGPNGLIGLLGIAKIIE